MNLSESYKNRLQELAGIDVTNFKDFSEEEYKTQLERLGIKNFGDLVGRTVYNIKPVYGEHKVLKWSPERGEYLLFTGGNRVVANPFNIIPLPEKTEKETDSELKWVIEKLCEEGEIKSIQIKDKSVDEKGALTVIFDLIITDHKNMFVVGRVDVEVSYKDVVLYLEIKDERLTSYLKGEGEQKILKSTDGNTQGKWDGHAPFIGPNYQTTNTDWAYMKKIVERIILEMI